MILQTKRLTLREMTADDLGALQAIMGDAETMAAYAGPFPDTEVAAWLNRQLANYQRYGYGLWAVEWEGRVIGQCGLTRQLIAGADVLEVGYLFNRAYWHCGYATEAARACIAYAFEHGLADEVWAQVRDSNTASGRVAERLGMTLKATFTKHYRGVDMPHLGFSVLERKEG
ncbi:MAG: GNAT family N-acetyltransferase [Propionibacteriaceae bacterium]|nr:GNAT family N-acetyltransferase [Propionibacteriaceae bacterium]